MKKNMGKLDRMARIIVALIIGILYATNVISGTLAIVLMILGVVFLTTSLLSFLSTISSFWYKNEQRRTN